MSDIAMKPEVDLNVLLAKLSRQDRDAFAPLYRATSAKLYGVILRILRRRDIADEVLQEVFVKIWERAGDFKPELASPMAWMITIARNRALDEIRRKLPVSIEDHPEVENLASTDEGALTEALKAEDAAQLADCLAKLGTDRRQMVVLAYCEGYSRDELAAKYGQPVNTIKTWLRRSLAQLRGCLAP